MKYIDTVNAVGHVICHDMTQIIPGKSKEARFRKGHIVAREDIPVLLSMGKEKLYVWEFARGMLHEDQAALALLELCRNENMTATAPKEGKLELIAGCDGLFTVDAQRLMAVNSLEDLMIATRHGNTAVKKGDKLAGMRVIPLVIAEEKLAAARLAAGEGPLMSLTPFTLSTAAVITTGSEVKKGLIEDGFTPVVAKKLGEYGMKVVFHQKVGDGREEIIAAIAKGKALGVDLILCTGGMSVDPDDRTSGAIKAAGARIVSYGAPVLPGAMLLVGYLQGTPILGLPGCVMYAKATIFDLLLPRIATGVAITKGDIVRLGHGGLCLGCDSCHYPSCGFGKGE